MDAWIGGLLRALDARGLTERSVIAVTADHGEEFGDRGGLHHSHTLFGELVDVPLLLAAPGAGPGATTSRSPSARSRGSSWRPRAGPWTTPSSRALRA